MALEKLEEELYKEKSAELKRRAAPKRSSVAPEKREVPSWQEEAGPEEEGVLGRLLNAIPRIRRWVIGGILALVLILVGIGGFYFYQGLTAKGVVLQIEGAKEVFLGVPITIAVSYANNGQSILRDAKVSLNLPEGISFVNASPDQRVEARNIGDLGVGSMGKEEFQVIALQNPQSVQGLSASIDYIASKLGSRFERDASADLTVNEPAIRVSLSAPEKVLSGEEFQVALSYENISNYDFSDIEVRLDYPPTFSFKNSSVPPTEGNYLWRLGDLRSGSKGELIIKGSAMGKADSFLEIKSVLSTSLSGRRYTLEDKSARLSISPSSLPLQISVNNQTDYIAGPGEQLAYTISYENNKNVNFRDVVLRARLIGEMYNLQNISSNGFFSSVDNTLTWNAANTSGFANLGPGESGSVTFTVGVKNDYPIKRLNDKNFILKVSAQIESPTVPPNVAAQKTTSLADLESKVKGRIAADARALFRDAASGIVNSGPIPPRVNMTTNYTVHWSIANFPNDAESVEVSAHLESGVTFTGKVKSTIVSVPAYNDRTQEVTWKIDRIVATKGVISQPVEATFQVAATPSIGNMNQYMPLVSQTELRARDAFTGLDLVSVAAPLTTYLLYDTTLTPQQGIVVN